MYQPSNIFAGRIQDLALLKTAFERTLSGHGQVVTVSGEPGIGKTRLVRQLADVARAQDTVVLWGQCPEVRGAPAYWPWIRIIGSCVDEIGPALTESLDRPTLSHLSRLIPELRAPRSSDEPTSDPDTARFQMFNSVATLLKGASETRPLLIVLDDLHQADVPSLRLLEFLARETADARVMILGTFRNVEVSGDHPFRDVLGEFARLESSQRLHLEGLELEEVGDFVGQAMEDKRWAEHVSALHRRSEGNPLYLIEMLRVLETERMGENALRIDQEIPETIRDLIRRRLNRLSASCNEALSRASVLGRDFHVAHLGRLLNELPTEELLDALDEALMAGIIEDNAPPPGRYRFTHILIRDTLEDELSPIQQARLHAHAGAVLEALYETDLRGHASELAYHFAMASPVTDSEKSVRYSLLAGEIALESYAWEDALSHFQKGLGSVDQIGDDLKPALLFGTAKAQTALASFEEAWDNLLSALDIYVDMGDADNAVAVAEYPVPYVGGLQGIAIRLEKALSLVPQGSIAAGRLLSRYGRLLNLVESDYEGAVAAFDLALDIARREEDEELEQHVLMDAADVDLHELRWTDLLTKCLRAMELGRPQRDPSARFEPLFLAGQALTAMGRPKEAEPHATAAFELARTLNNGELLTRASYSAEKLHHYLGDWDSATNRVEQGLSAVPSNQQLIALRALLAYETGRFDEGRVFIERLFDVVRGPKLPGSLSDVSVAVILPHLSRITENEEWLDIAEKAATSVIGSPHATLLYKVSARTGLGFIAASRKDARLAEEQYAHLAPHRKMVFPFTLVERVLGLIATAMGDSERAVAHFLEAEEFLAGAGYGPELVWTYHDHVQSIYELNAGASVGEVERLAGEGLSITRALGMGPLAKRLESLQALLAPGPSHRSAFPGGLTEREVEILRLLAEGRTNRQIGRQLVISVNTVQRHVSNILAKTDSANRTESVRYAIRNGLV